jgi:hypothetical protein
MNHEEAIIQMLKNLDSWRHLPKYQLERRADLFFGLFIKKILASSNCLIEDELFEPIPEFPFRYDKNNPENPKTFHTVNFDYVLFTKEKKQNKVNSFIVELKTDLSSAGERNNSYLTKAKDTEFSEIVNNILIVAKESKSPEKYRCLLAKMSENKIIRGKQDTWEEEPHLGKPKIIYLAPFDEANPSDNKKIAALRKKGFMVIGFKEIADIIDDKQDNSFQHLFARCLREWNDVKAGSVCHG